ncbi:16S rRNA (uracil(1498)-N(3))-methyltransferase [Nesterenkonia ebinurensis]|uniref:16S rRNA (uracil(1498)-N(3))-methyltransferase n=1 Tax=Nesterenkonia ebinurensis TaxID=2608252 RepID=UPI00123D2B75|nr:16S rRNA (uracil(1498)-N(3))-methyltransferase [Nesterenkonia ebinurensis]
MTAPLFHLSPGALDGAAAGSVVTLSGAEGYHAATVMRLGTGEPIQLSDTRARRADGVVLSTRAGELHVEVRELIDEPVLRPALVLVQALAKDKRDLQAVESATELGVDAVIPWDAQRSVARWKAGREAKKHAEWENTVRSAAKQTRRTAIPEVRPLHTTTQYCQWLQSMNEAVTGFDQEPPKIAALVLHERESRSLLSVLCWDFGLLYDDLSWAADEEIEELHILVGPEGGISDEEIEQLTQAGARTALLGKNVLRASTAGPAGISAIQLLRGDWGTLAQP